MFSSRHTLSIHLLPLRPTETMHCFAEIASAVRDDLIAAVRHQHLPYGRAEVEIDLWFQLGKEIFSALQN